MDDDLIYYRRRFRQETMLVDAAASVEAALVHRALAKIYAVRMRRLAPQAVPPRGVAPMPATASRRD